MKQITGTGCMCSGIAWPGRKSTRVVSTRVTDLAGSIGKLPIGVRVGIGAATAALAVISKIIGTARIFHLPRT